MLLINVSILYIIYVLQNVVYPKPKKNQKDPINSIIKNIKTYPKYKIKEFPPFIYNMDINKINIDENKNLNYARYLYSKNRYNKVIFVYQYIINKSPNLLSILDFWRLGESYFWRKDFHLARHYFKKIINKNQNYKLNILSNLRLFDINYMMGKNPKFDEIKDLQTYNDEIKAQIFIRKLFLKDKNMTNITENDYIYISSFDNISRSSSFVISSVIINHILNKNIINKNDIKKIIHFLNLYKKENINLYNNKLNTKIKKWLYILYKNKKYNLIIYIYENFNSKHFEKIKTLHIIADSYFNLNLYYKSLKLYKNVYNLYNFSNDKMIVFFKIMIISSFLNNDKIKEYDKKILNYWNSLKFKDKNKFYISINYDLSNLIDKTTSSIRIILDLLEYKYNKNKEVNIKTKFTNLELIEKILKISKKNNMNENIQKIYSIVYNYPKEKLNENINTWTDILNEYAVSLKKQEKYIKSANVFKKICDYSIDLYIKSKNCYRSGLLFYKSKSGNISKAVESFKKASSKNINNNYSRLAKIALNKINQGD